MRPTKKPLREISALVLAEESHSPRVIREDFAKALAAYKSQKRLLSLRLPTIKEAGDLAGASFAPMLTRLNELYKVLASAIPEAYLSKDVVALSDFIKANPPEQFENLDMYLLAFLIDSFLKHNTDEELSVEGSAKLKSLFALLQRLAGESASTPALELAAGGAGAAAAGAGAGSAGVGAGASSESFDVKPLAKLMLRQLAIRFKAVLPANRTYLEAEYAHATTQYQVFIDSFNINLIQQAIKKFVASYTSSGVKLEAKDRYESCATLLQTEAAKIGLRIKVEDLKRSYEDIGAAITYPNEAAAVLHYLVGRIIDDPDTILEGSYSLTERFNQIQRLLKALKAHANKDIREAATRFSEFFATVRLFDDRSALPSLEQAQDDFLHSYQLFAMPDIEQALTISLRLQNTGSTATLASTSTLEPSLRELKAAAQGTIVVKRAEIAAAERTCALALHAATTTFNLAVEKAKADLAINRARHASSTSKDEPAVMAMLDRGAVAQYATDYAKAESSFEEASGAAYQELIRTKANAEAEIVQAEATIKSVDLNLQRLENAASAAAAERVAVPVNFVKADGAEVIQQLMQRNIKELGLRYAAQFCALQALAREEKSLVAGAGAGAAAGATTSSRAASLDELITHLATVLGQSKEQLRAQIDTVLHQLEAQASLNGGTAVATFAIRLVGARAEAELGAAGAMVPTGGSSSLVSVASWFGGLFSWGAAGTQVGVQVTGTGGPTATVQIGVALAPHGGAGCV